MTENARCGIMNKEKVFTIPNALSLFRIILIPFFIHFYFNNNCNLAFIVLLISTLSDVLDGLIARSCGMISDLGKVLDPLADKITHAAIIICLALRFKWIRLLFAVFAVKEITMLILGIIVLKKTNMVYSAKWYGKLCTTFTFITMTVHLLFPNISTTVSMLFCLFNILLMVNALVRYAVLDLKLIRSANNQSYLVGKS